MNYQQSREYIEEAQKYGSVLGLSGMREMMRRLGNPQDELKYVHVAGTNGKGSVIAYLYTVLSQAGYRVGRYISPALYSYRERMEAAGQKVSREKFASYLTRIAGTAEEMQRDGFAHPTVFEMETAAAFLFFQEEKCDLVLLEVGMGGDLDATNIIKNTLLAVIVSISMDHREFLGDTPAQIAEKKAGIIKPGCRAVTVRQEPEVSEVIRKRCEELDVPLTESDHTQAQILKESLEGQSFCYRGKLCRVSLAGVCQVQNAVLALDVLEILGTCGFATSWEERQGGLAKACWNGRFTVLHENPLMIVDGAHNPGAAQMLSESIEHYLAGRRLIYIMGMFRDKDYRAVIERTCPYAEIIFTIQTPDNPRALPARELAEAVRSLGKDARPMETIADAVEAALAAAEKEDVILAFGSLSFIGELTGIMKKYRKPGGTNKSQEETG